nr:DNA translocase FtsK [uncultured Cellulosilyticum sp.]
MNKKKKKNGPKTGNKNVKRKPVNRSNTHSPISKEIVGICMVGVSLLILIGLFTTKSGLIGEMIRTIFVGLFGIGGYIIPLIAVGVGVFYIQGNLKRVVQTLVYTLSFLLLLITFFHVLYYKEAVDEILWSLYYIEQGAWFNGGFIGAALGYLLLSLFGLYGTYVVLSVLTAVWLLIVTQFPIFSWIHVRCSEVFANMSKNLKSHSKYTKQPKIRVGKLKDEVKGEEAYNFESIPIYNASEYQGDKGINIVDESADVPSYLDEMQEQLEEEVFDAYEQTLSESHMTPSQEVPLTQTTSNQNASVAPGRNMPLDLGSKDESLSQSTNVSVQNPTQPMKEYTFPSIELLNKVQVPYSKDASKKSLSNAKKLEETLASFGVEAKVTQIHKGPAVTRYELQPKQGVKVSKIVNLADDIALNLAAPNIRIEAPIPGKAAVGIEVANESSEMVYLRDVIDSDRFIAYPSKLAFALGKDIAGKPIVTDIAKMPHILIAGATGSGKSVCINTLITSILYKARPDEVKLIMIDPKVVELSVYNGIPHLLIPVVTDPKKAAGALFWAVNEMTRRYNLFAENNVRDMKGYNEKQVEESMRLPQIVIIIDELADLMMTGAKEVEDAICRLAQMARAAGIHLVIATQRPSVDVITGVIKANIPSRLAFAVSSGTDSRTILDMTGAEKLLGKGDMLFYPVGESKPIRIQGAFISDKEVESIVNAIRTDEVNYEESVIQTLETATVATGDGQDEDALLEDAIAFAAGKEKLSISMLQRYFRIGFNRAARLMDALESRGIVGPDEGSKPRRVL